MSVTLLDRQPQKAGPATSVKRGGCDVHNVDGSLANYVAPQYLIGLAVNNQLAKSEGLSVNDRACVVVELDDCCDNSVVFARFPFRDIQSVSAWRLRFSRSATVRSAATRVSHSTKPAALIAAAAPDTAISASLMGIRLTHLKVDATRSEWSTTMSLHSRVGQQMSSVLARN
jgi:hypothetical protein